MAISKKGSRTITIHGEVYRWILSPRSGSVLLIVESGTGQGQRMEVLIPTEASGRSAGTAFGVQPEMRIVTPKDVEGCIRQALSSGWKPTAQGAPLTFDLRGDLLVPRG
ncbi:hypothetical protein PM3016_3610 [Paenibacillus mucilaginosus 3016]|uniref:Uncharacterized protein n=1 Tax=Paenibacillus mucilaginosus 3016 TaxID=1116391 RepID=H6NMU4_9BACL|nr:hypothetical protein [Paenibacillus mucilaginosus]AFC30431.1 hypothetical protein PM3016_3610 [Paenibacillus mucilaginosus 3016]WFA19068.1 hypothetical protein ERY13_18215 [Paenibacillus mucilaginosus]